MVRNSAPPILVIVHGYSLDVLQSAIVHLDFKGYKFDTLHFLC